LYHKNLRSPALAGREKATEFDKTQCAMYNGQAEAEKRRQSCSPQKRADCPVARAVSIDLIYDVV